MAKIYTLNNKIITINNKWTQAVEETPVDPYNPLGLPPNTVRVRTSDGNVPSKSYGASYETATLVSGTSDVYDVYKSGTNFTNLFNASSNMIEVLGANTTGITNMYSMFTECRALTTVPLFDTHNVTNMYNMFGECQLLTTVPLFDTSNANNMKYMFLDCKGLTTVPLFDTSKVSDMKSMFYNCYKVQSGALALYQQASSQTNPPTSYNDCFYNCGRDTTTGSAELAQIPSSWGGTGA